MDNDDFSKELIVIFIIEFNWYMGNTSKWQISTQWGGFWQWSVTLDNDVFSQENLFQFSVFLQQCAGPSFSFGRKITTQMTT